MRCLICDGTGKEKNPMIGVMSDLPPFIDCERCNGIGQVDFYTHDDLKSQTIPEFIKWCCEYAKGFRYVEIKGWEHQISFKIGEGIGGEIILCELLKILESDKILEFLTLLCRTVDGWNKTKDFLYFIMPYENGLAMGEGKTFYEYKNYQSTALTSYEMAKWHCLIDIFKKMEK